MVKVSGGTGQDSVGLAVHRYGAGTVELMGILPGEAQVEVEAPWGPATLTPPLAAGPRIAMSPMDDLAFRLGNRILGNPAHAAGLELTVSGAPAAGDVFRVRPANNAAAGLDVVLTDPSLIAAAAPLETATVAGNIGSATVSAATATDLTDPGLLTAVRIRFDDPPTSYQVTAPDGTPLTGSLPYTSGADISFNGWTLQVSGTPLAGDQFTVGSAGANSGGNANALELAAVFTRGFFDAGRSSTQDLSAQLTTTVGSFAARSNADFEVQTAIRGQLELDVEAVRGVNLDEEAANILRYQEAYLAASRAISVANDLFQSIINAIR